MGNGGLTLYLDGTPAQTLGYGHIGIELVEHVWSPSGSGLHQVQFDLPRQRRSVIPQLRQGVRVEVRRGPVRLGTAILGDVTPDGSGLVADGLYRRAERFPALAAGPVVSTNPRAIVTWANTQGLGWGDPAGLPDVSVAASDGATLTTLAGVLNAYCAINGKVWGLDAFDVPFVADKPTAADLTLRPGVPGMPTGDDDYANHVALRYASRMTTPTGGSGDSPVPDAWRVAVAHGAEAVGGDRWYFEDISDLGLLASTPSASNTLAQTIATRMVAERGARLAFTSGVEVQPWQVATNGGISPSSWMPLHGRRLRHLGVLTERATPNLAGSLEWVVGRSIYRPASRTRELVPTELADRTLSQIAKLEDNDRLTRLFGQYVGMSPAS